MPPPAPFAQVFSRHRPTLERYLLVRSRDSAQADEVLQETFTRAFVRRETLRDEDRMAPWLIGIARRVLAEERRRARREETVETKVAPLEAPPCDDPVAQLEAQETSRVLTSAILGLEEERRSALMLRVDADLPYDDIATRLGWSVAKVKNEIHRARRHLRHVLAGVLGAMLLGLLAHQWPPRQANLALEEDAPSSCFESGLGAVAALEAEHRACLLATPATSLDTTLMCR